MYVSYWCDTLTTCITTNELHIWLPLDNSVHVQQCGHFTFSKPHI